MPQIELVVKGLTNMRKFITPSFILLCTTANADWHLPDERYIPGYYAVTNVAPDDVLNVRAEPRGSSPKLGSIAFNTEIVEIVSTNSAGSWGMVRMGEHMGWTSMRYLRPTRVTTFGGTNIPIGLRCFLEEPFVTYTFGAGVIIESRLGSAEQNFPIVEIIPNDTQYKIYFEESDIIRNISITMDAKGTSTMADVLFLWSFSIDGSNLGTAGCTLF
jgi:hypothetical protein